MCFPFLNYDDLKQLDAKRLNSGFVIKQPYWRDNVPRQFDPIPSCGESPPNQRGEKHIRLVIICDPIFDEHRPKVKILFPVAKFHIKTPVNLAENASAG